MKSKCNETCSNVMVIRQYARRMSNHDVTPFDRLRVTEYDGLRAYSRIWDETDMVGFLNS
ncbi:MAG: hypothetical protein AB1442_02535 [Nitrospirota bacterium]